MRHGLRHRSIYHRKQRELQGEIQLHGQDGVPNAEFEPSTSYNTTHTSPETCFVITAKMGAKVRGRGVA